MDVNNLQPINSQIHYNGKIIENKNKKHISYSRNVQFNDTNYKITVKYPLDQNISNSDIQRDMDAQVDNMVQIVKIVGLDGKNGLNKIKINQDNQIIGTWNTENEGKRSNNLIKELNSGLKKVDSDPKEQAKIKDQLSNLEKVTSLFKEKFPKASMSIVANSPVSNLIPAPPIRPPSPTGLSTFETFNSHLDNAMSNATNLHLIDIARNRRILELNLDSYSRLSSINIKDPSKLQDIEQIRTDLHYSSQHILIDSNLDQEETFADLEENVTKMTQSYNSLRLERQTLMESPQAKAKPQIYSTQLTQIDSQLAQMQSKIKEYNVFIGNRNLPTNEAAAAKSKIMEFSAVVEKKLSLMEEGSKLVNSHTNSNRFDRIYKELRKAPELNKLESLSKVYEKKLSTAELIVSPEETKIINKPDLRLKWGASHLPFALTAPSNWVNINTAFIKTSDSGTAFVSVTKFSPLNVENAGGVPARLRTHLKYENRAVNLMQSTTYLRGGDTLDSSSNAPFGAQVSYRGGQFPSVQAAKEALVQIIETLPPGQKIDKLHINSLLTPMMFTSLIKDKKLLETHKKNILRAIDELIVESQFTPSENRDFFYVPGDAALESLKNLKQNISISNYGVNAGATGEIKVLMHRMKAGWHESIGRYSNSASQKLNANLKNKLDSIDTTNPSTKDLDRLGAILQVGQEIEAMWANNDYADGDVGNNPFKMPAMLMVMDGLIDETTFVNCMSGKDRTGETVSNAQFFNDEINMNIVDHKKALTLKFNDLSKTVSPKYAQEWQDQKNILTAACFTEEDLNRIHSALKGKSLYIGTTEATFKELITWEVERKIAHTKAGLGYTKNGSEVENGFLQKKAMFLKGIFNIGTHGISKNPPLIISQHHERGYLPSVLTSSVYLDKEIDLNSPLRLADIKDLEMRQNMAFNRKLSQLSGSLQVTQMNTGFTGFKVGKSEALARFTSGFDRDFVLYQFNQFNQNLAQYDQDPKKREEFVQNFISKFSSWTNLNELDDKNIQEVAAKEWGDKFAVSYRETHFGKASRQRFEEALTKIIDSTESNEYKLKALTSFLKDIENAKLQSIKPRVKVAS